MSNISDEAVELLPCPFCGGEAVAANYAIEAGVRCLSCHAQIIRSHGPRVDTGYPQAIAAWNERAALSAAAPHMSVKVKGLEWEFLPDGFPPMWTADTPFGHYSIVEAPTEHDAAGELINTLGAWGVFHGPAQKSIGYYYSLNEAKAAAQADYEARILSALAATPPPSLLDEVKAVLEFYRDGFKPKGAKYGIEYRPTEELLEDCGNKATDALAKLKESQP